MLKMLYLLLIITFSLCQDIPFIESIESAFGEVGSEITSLVQWSLKPLLNSIMFDYKVIL